ncbi:MAG: hypothetical protein AABW65_00875 [Nanoarchaeota archaeon]
MKLRKCINHTQSVYTFSSICEKCNQQTKEAHYKFIKLKSVNTPIEDYEEGK